MPTARGAQTTSKARGVGFFFVRFVREAVAVRLPMFPRYFFPAGVYLVARTADNGWEDGARSVISGETGLAHAGAVVNNQSRNIIVTHDESFLWVDLNRKTANRQNNRGD